MLFICLFLRSAPHHLKANLARCTDIVPRLIRHGATRFLTLRPKGKLAKYLITLSNRRARNEKGQQNWP
ncbi:hypothetical protein FR762_22475 [Enterobacter sp. E76]|nr:hypothetical protein FR762_22475 [Enterobacter sp. E76]